MGSQVVKEDMEIFPQLCKLIHRVLTETQAWSPDEQINWSQLAREYGITSPNGGQLIKEFLRENNIPTAKINQRPSRAMCRCKGKVSAGSSITLPMFPTVVHEKAKLKECTSKGEIVIRDEVVPTTYDYYTVDNETHILHANTVNISARKIPLRKIR